MRSFAFRASLILPKTNRSVLFEREKNSFLALALRMNSTMRSEIRDKFMDLTSNWTQKVDFHDGVRSLTVYEAQRSYAAAAVIISIVSLFALASLFWGWWELGRDVSLNPLEVAMAFNSSMFEEVNSNSRRSQIVRVVGPQKVIYSGAKAARRNREGQRIEEGERNEEGERTEEGERNEAGERNDDDDDEEEEEQQQSFNRGSLRLRLKFNYIDERNEHGADAVLPPPMTGDMFS